MRNVVVCVKWSIVFAGLLNLIAFARQAPGQDDAVTHGMQRVPANQLFHHQSGQKMGLLIPLYIYPGNIHTNAD